jgi:hypothetical protein
VCRAAATGRRCPSRRTTTNPGEAGDPIEVDRLVNGTGLISLADANTPSAITSPADA